MLFYSKIVAQNALDCRPDSNEFRVRGVSQEHLRIIVGLQEAFDLETLICINPILTEENSNALQFASIPPDALRENYIY